MNGSVSTDRQISTSPAMLDRFKRLPLRLRAFIYHGLISAFAISLVCFAALKWWFPYPLYLLDGTLGALFTLALVDMAIGPLITLVVSSRDKKVKERILDYTVVGLVQAAALVYGLMQIHSQKIDALVHIENEFHLVPHSEIVQEVKNDSLSGYESVLVGMLVQEDFNGLTETEIKRKIYDPNQYHELIGGQILKGRVPFKNVPGDLLDRHGKNAIYKLIIGKKNHGIAVLDESMQIVDIGLAKK